MPTDMVRKLQTEHRVPDATSASRWKPVDAGGIGIAGADVCKPNTLTVKDRDVRQFEIVNNDSSDDMFGPGNKALVLPIASDIASATTDIVYTVDGRAGDWKLI